MWWKRGKGYQQKVFGKGDQIALAQWKDPHVFNRSVVSIFLLPNGLSSRPDSLSMGFPRQEYWSGLPSSPEEDLSDPGIEPASPVSPALQLDSLPTEPSENANLILNRKKQINPQWKHVCQWGCWNGSLFLSKRISTTSTEKKTDNKQCILLCAKC